jgi:hypothetical protein
MPLSFLSLLVEIRRMIYVWTLSTEINDSETKSIKGRRAWLTEGDCDNY